jgi:glycosyltransferase involved in cell wall biosynthesis
MKYTEGVSIILCCHNSEQLLPETLQHLANLSVPSGLNMELILVDNASTDGTADIAGKFWESCNAPFSICILQEVRQGLIYARKLGVKQSGYSYLLFVDDDNHLHRNYIIEMVSIFRNYDDVAAVGGCNTPVFEAEKPFWFSRFQHSYAAGSLADEFGEPHETGLFGAGLSIRHSALDGLFGNGFESKLIGRQGKTLTSGEDFELCKALKIAGWKIFFSPGLRLEHLITSQRLKWEYFRKLNEGISRSIVFFLAYEFWIEMDKTGNSFFTKAKYFWPIMIIRKWLKVMVLKFKMNFDPESKNEGSELLINYERALIVALDFWHKRKDFIRLKKEIGQAVWRKSVDFQKSSGHLE